MKGKCKQVGLKINNRLYQLLRIKRIDLMSENAKKYTFDGMTHTLSEWSKITGIPHRMLNTRLREGWTFQRAITTNPRRSSNDQIDINGRKFTICELSEKYGLSARVIMYRLKHTDWNI
jgi:hypothetical protein